MGHPHAPSSKGGQRPRLSRAGWTPRHVGGAGRGPGRFAPSHRRRSLRAVADTISSRQISPAPRAALCPHMKSPPASQLGSLPLPSEAPAGEDSRTPGGQGTPEVSPWGTESGEPSLLTPAGAHTAATLSPFIRAAARPQPLLRGPRAAASAPASSGRRFAAESPPGKALGQAGQGQAPTGPRRAPVAERLACPRPPCPRAPYAPGSPCGPTSAGGALAATGDHVECGRVGAATRMLAPEGGRTGPPPRADRCSIRGQVHRLLRLAAGRSCPAC